MKLHSFWIFALIYITLINGERCPDADAKEVCNSESCSELLRCDFPKKRIDYCDPVKGCCMKRVCTCTGTNNGLSISGTLAQIFRGAEWLYTNCTLVEGNVELVNIEQSVAFTKHIEQVTGYILISRFTGAYIDFSSLRLIRGLELHQEPPQGCKGTAEKAFEKATNQSSRSPDVREYALSVVTNNMGGGPGFKELWMPNLTEITYGDVVIRDNKDLCYVDTVKWEDIFENQDQRAEVDNSTSCPACSSECHNDGGVRHCWGNLTSQCQLLARTNCDSCIHIPNRRCVIQANGLPGCCNPECAGGCFAPSDKTACYVQVKIWSSKHEPRQLTANHLNANIRACDNLNDDGVCVNTCPDGLSVNPNSQEETATDVKYQFAGYCVTQCPDNVPRNGPSGRFCQTYCPENKYDFDSNICEDCDDRCGNICTGLGVANTDLEEETTINAINIKDFNKNCTIIQGSVHIKKTAFDGDRYCRVNETDMREFERFENVREITGYLAIEEWRDTDLCIFKNLRRIHGRTLLHGQYALSIHTDSSKRSPLLSLCLNSLQQIDRGGVQLFNQRLLCYADQIHWNNIIEHSELNQSEFQVKAAKDCGDVLIMKNRRLCNHESVNWTNLLANPDEQKFTIRGGKRPKKCTPCHPLCKEGLGCWGNQPTQCVECKYFTDRTNADGQFVSDFVTTANGKIYPGNNVTTCVDQCDVTKGVYGSSDYRCLPCDEECFGQCVGPGPTNCVECKNFKHNDTCVKQCLEHEHFIVNTTCVPCDVGCIEGGCAGAVAGFDVENGCRFCYTYQDTEKQLTFFEGRCEECTKMQLDCFHGCTRNATGHYQCIEVPGVNLAAILVPVFTLIVVVPLVIFLFCCRKHKSTIKQMRKTIGENMVGEHKVDDIESIPMTPSGAAPNQAHLRIVKDTELNIGKLLGSGAFGEVHKAIWTPLNIQGEKIKIAVAVKTLKAIADMSPCANNEIMDEAYVMASVDCDYLVRLLGIRMTENVSLITQLMPLGSLLEYVREIKNHDAINSRQMLTWFVQIAKGMLYLQEKHLVHRDLAARNVLVRTPNHVKITDFGLAKMLDIREESYQAEGGKLPIKWLAIECITERLFSHLSDVWAYGITCWEILTFGGRPYEGVRAAEILNLLERGDRLPQPPTATIEVYMLLVKCWMVDRISRPSFAELVAEFSRMAMDPSRYLVLQNDTTSCFSPNPTEEDQFFQRLLQEEKLDDGVIADEPDQYLLFRDCNDQMGPVYANQEAVVKTLGTHPANAPERLFSRSTPSAVIDPAGTSSTSTERVRDSDLTRINSGSDQDDVFSEAAQTAKQFNVGGMQGESRNNRKDSEENHRYTEDPTRKKMTLGNIDEKFPEPVSKYDEDQYLLPIENKAPVYLDPEGGSDVMMTSALMNDTYVDSPPFSGGSSQHPSSGGTDYTMLAACEEQNEVEYVNTRDREAPNWFANEEYMATDSGIGEDTQSLLSRGATGKSSKQTDSPRSSGDENERLLLRDSRASYRTERSHHNGLSRPANKPCSTSSDTSTVSCSSPTALNNPGYMFLNASTSNNSNKNMKVQLDPVADETAV